MDTFSAFLKGEVARDRIKRGLQKTIKQYDYKKAKEMILKHKPKEAGLFMAYDKGWTYDAVWKDGEFIMNLDEEPKIAGIKASTWATPMLDMDGEEYECYIEIEVGGE